MIPKCHKAETFEIGGWKAVVANHFLLTLEHIVLPVGFTTMFSKMGMESQTSWLGAWVWL